MIQLSVAHPHWTQVGLVISVEFYQSLTVRAVDGRTEAVYCCPEEALVVCHVAHELTLSVDVLHDSDQTLIVSVTLQTVPHPHLTQVGLVISVEIYQSLTVPVADAWIETVYYCLDTVFEDYHAVHDPPLHVEDQNVLGRICCVSVRLLSNLHLH